MKRSRPYSTTAFRDSLRSTMVFTALALLVLPGCQATYKPTKLLEERNFVIGKAAGKPAPAAPSSDPDVSRGRLAVSIDGEKHKLETLTVTPPGKGPFPLAVISHGNSRNQRRVQLDRYQPIAEDFAERGYMAVVFARRGAAFSTGEYVDNMRGCRHLEAGRTSAEDYAAAIEALTRRPDIDRSTIIAAGQSGGGFAVLVLASQQPAGLIGVVNFAGGRGGNNRDEQFNCDELGFVNAFSQIGKTARVPSLWLYSTADRFFWPDLVKDAFDAFSGGGAPVRLKWFGPLRYAEDGHRLYRGAGQELWSPHIGNFLRDIGAPHRKAGGS